MIKYWILVNFDELDSILNDRLSFRISIVWRICQNQPLFVKISHIFRDREFLDFELRLESQLKKLPPIFSLRKIPKTIS